MVFPVVMYACESWTIKKVESRRVDAFKLWCWRRLLRVSWTANPEGNKSWIFIGRTDAEIEASILWPPDAKNWLIGEDPDYGKDWKQEEKGMTEDEIVRWPTQWTWVWVNSGSWWWTGKPGVLQSTGVTKSWTRLSNWAELTVSLE